MKIALITGSRAEWGLLKSLVDQILNEPSLDLRLIVTGSHLSPEFGMTINEIRPKYEIHETVECILSSDTPVAISKGIGLAIISFGEVYERIKPDLLVILGDRFEILAAAIAAHISNIPICHIHGGEVTEGVYDDGFRHSITKMSQLHFVAAEPYRRRVIQLGERPSNVFIPGALGCEGLEKEQTEKKGILIAYYPTTLDWFMEPDDVLYILMKRNEDFDFILPNYDRYAHHVIANQIHKRPISMPRKTFINRLKISIAIIGNSSAGIIEAPALGIPTINIGDRQKGRLMADSIIQAEPTKESITAAFDKLYSKQFQDMMKADYYTPYQGGNVAKKITDIIKERIGKIEMKKGFYDLP